MDPLHVSATYVVPATLKERFRIVVTPFKRGKAVSLVEVRLLQPASSGGRDSLVVLAQMYLNNFAARGSPDAPIAGPSLKSDSQYLTRCGLTDVRRVMATVEPRPGHKKFHFRDVSRFYPDREFNRRSREQRGPGENGAAGFWFELDRSGEEDGLAKGREHGVGYNWLGIACDVTVLPIVQFRIKAPDEE